MLLADCNGRILRANPALTRLLGYSADDMLERQILDFVASDSAVSCRLQLQELFLARRDRFRGEIVWARRESPNLPTFLSAALIRNSPEAQAHILATVESLPRHSRIEERLSTLTYYNRFTGLPSHLLLKDRLEHALLRAARDRSRLALLRLKLRGTRDGKNLFGPVRSDRLLPELAGRLKSCLRQGDTIAHLANDEFAIILENIGGITEPANAARIIIDRLASPISLETGEVSIDAGIGVALFPEDGSEAGALLQNAASAMLRAGEKGRSACRYFSREMHRQVLFQHRRRHRLSGALARQEMVVHYQPLGDPIRGEVTGVEALLRWHHPQKGLILPGEFIPDLEAVGLIDSVGEWVLRQACRQLRQWRAEGRPELGLAVNISARQLRLPHFPGQVKAILAESGLDPSALTLEIPESAVLDPFQTAPLVELTAFGVQVSLDDFGTGGASLGHLKQFPLHSLKIDRRLVQGIPHCRADVDIASSIIAMGRHLGIRVSAKGVENREQLAFLHSLRCREIQGFLFARPMPAAELDGWLENGLPA